MTTDHPHDDPLRQRMTELQIPSWNALRQKAGISRRALDHLRQGTLDPLKLGQIRAVATALDWSSEELLSTLQVLPQQSSEPSPPDPSTRQDVILEVQHHTFDRLQTLLTSYPSARQMAQAQPTLPAKNLIALFRSLDALLSDWQIQTIGSPWEQVSYDPQLHQPDSPDISPGEPVYIRYVGYRQGVQILCPAKVSRSLPKGAA